MYIPPTVYDGNLFFGYQTKSLSSNPQLTKIELTLTFNSNLKIYIENNGSNSFIDFTKPPGYYTSYYDLYYVINVPLIDDNTDIVIQSYEENEWKNYEYTYQNLLKFFSNEYAIYNYNLYIHTENNLGETDGGASSLLFYNLNFGYSPVPDSFTLNNKLNFNSKIYTFYNKLIYFDPYYNNGSIESFNFNCHTVGSYDNTKTVCLFFKIISKGNKQQTLYYANNRFNIGSETNFIYGCMGEALHDEEMANNNLITSFNVSNNPNLTETQQEQYREQINNAATHNFHFGFGETSAIDNNFLNNFSDPQKIIFCIRVYNGNREIVGEKISNNDFDNLPEVIEEFILPTIDIVSQKIEVQKADAIRYKTVIKNNKEIDIFSSNNTDKIRLDINIKNNLNELVPADNIELYLYGGYKLTVDEYNEFWDWYQKDQPDFFDEWHNTEHLEATEITAETAETLTWQSHYYDMETSSGYTTTRDVDIVRHSYKKTYIYELSDIDKKRLNNFGTTRCDWTFSALGTHYDNDIKYKELVDEGSFFRLKFNMPNFNYIKIIETYTEVEEWLPDAPYYQMKEPDDYKKSFSFIFYDENDNDITENIERNILINYYDIHLLPSIGYKINKSVQNNNFNFSKIKTGFLYVPYFYTKVFPNNGNIWSVSASSTESDLTNDGDAWLLAIKDISMNNILNTIGVSETSFPVVKYVYILYNKTLDDTYFNIENNGVAIGTGVSKENVFNKSFTIDEEYVTYFNGKTNIFPVGSIYLSLSSLNPSRYFVGTWVPFGQGRTLIGVDGGFISNPAWDTWYENGGEGEEPPVMLPGPYNDSGMTGGEETHTLTIDEMPSHTHNRRTDAGNRGAADGDTTGSQGYKWHAANNTETTATGGGKPHNNMPPYITCYMWLRTS